MIQEFRILGRKISTLAKDKFTLGTQVHVTRERETHATGGDITGSREVPVGNHANFAVAGPSTG